MHSFTCFPFTDSGRWDSSLYGLSVSWVGEQRHRLTLKDDEIRVKILQDIYARAKKGDDPLTNASDYASLLDIAPTLANFHLQYLVESGLVDGQVIPGGKEGVLDAEELEEEIQRALEDKSKIAPKAPN